ncbi:MAG: helix-turn-helix transcriptional regulator [Streptosporangiaceae bacterium]
MTTSFSGGRGGRNGLETELRRLGSPRKTGSRTTPDPLLTVADMCAELGGVSRRTFYRWRELGVGPQCLKIPTVSRGRGAVSSRRGSIVSATVRHEIAQRPVLGDPAEEDRQGGVVDGQMDRCGPGEVRHAGWDTP